MLLNAYTIHDCKSLQYHSPWFAVSDGAATRTLTELTNDLNTMIGRHPKDYTLWKCGIWDDNAGIFQPVSPLIHIVDCIALVRVDERPLTLPLAMPEQAQPNGKDR